VKKKKESASALFLRCGQKFFKKTVAGCLAALSYE